MSDSDRDAFAATLASPSANGGSPSPKGPPTLRDGTVLGGTYRIEALIGRGAMGAVYRATHEKLRRTFAVKLLAVDPSLGIDAEAAWRLVQEARTASAIDHENIVDVTDLGQTEDGQIYVVMELLKGHDLDDRIEMLSGQPMANDEVRELSAQMLEGLAAAHEAGVIHRDLKPANVFLATRRSGTRVKLVDFGMAKALETQTSVQLTRSGQLMGTPLYMSPEQAQGRNVDRRSDVYAVGVMLYEMLAGEVPFPAESLYECVLSHATKEPPRLVDRRPDLPHAVVEVVHRCLLKNPEQRYADARELAEAWRSAWSRADVGSTAASDQPIPHPPEPVVATPQPQASSRAPWVGGALLLALLGVAGWWATRTPSVPADEVAMDGAPTATPAAADPGSEPAVSDSVEEPTQESSESDETADTESTAQLPTGAAPPQTVHLTSDPPGALVLDGDTRIGRTPLDVEVTDAARELRLSLRGHRPATTTLAPDGPDTVSVSLLQRRSSMRGSRMPMLAPR